MRLDVLQGSRSLRAASGERRRRSDCCVVSDFEEYNIGAYIALLRTRAETAETRVRELEKVLRELLACPYTLDSASIPHAGVDAAPQQIVGVLSVGLVRMRAAQAALTAKGRLS